MIKNKKGQVTEHVVLWIPKLIYLIVAFLSVIFLLRFLVSNNVDSSMPEALVLANRIYYSPNVISFYDQSVGRSYPGIIDLAKFKSMQNVNLNQMDTSTITYGQQNSPIAAKITLVNLATNEESVVFYNKENFDYWEPRVLSTVSGGSGSVLEVNQNRYVLIKSQEGLGRGILKMQLLIRK